MMPSDSPRPPRSEVAKLKWFTEEEYSWRTGATVVWLLMILPFAVFINSVAVSIDVFHPISWLNGCIMLLFNMSFWSTVCIFVCLCIVTQLSYAKFNTVKDVVHHSRISAILFPLHPARMCHLLLFVSSGAVAAYNLFGIWSDEIFYFTRLSEKSETFCLNEELVFVVLFGAWLGLYSSVDYFMKKGFHFAFPSVLQQKFFLVKMSIGPCFKQSILTCLKATRWFYVLYYLFGNVPRDAFLSIAEVPLDSGVPARNTISGLLDLSLFWSVVTTGSLILFLWTFGCKLLVIFYTQRYTFPVESSFSQEQDQRLCVVIKNSTVPLLKFLAMFDLCHLSQFSSSRRKQIFSLSQPSGRPSNWADLSTECLHLIDSLTSRLLSAVSLQAHVQQSSLDAKQIGLSRNGNGYSNGHANGHANGNTVQTQSPSLYSSPLRSPLNATDRQTILSPPGKVQLWSESNGNAVKMPAPAPAQQTNVFIRLRTKANEKVDNFVWRLNQVPHNIACRLKERPVIGFLFDETPEARRKAIFADCQLHIWAVEALSRLVAASYTEDTYGVVQKSLPDIFISLVSLLQALDKHSKLSLALTSKPAIQARPPRPQGKDSLRYQLRTTLVSSIYRITNIFHEHLRNIPMAVEHQKKLQSFLEFKE